jgi:hypothetical protein
MPRVTRDELKAMLRPYADGAADTDLDLFIGQAEMLVDEELMGSGLSGNRLKYIELNLAAHYATVAIERGGFTYQKSMSSEEGYATPRDKVQLSSTRFGQQALSLDTTGKLAGMDSPGGKAEFRVV